MFVCVCGEEIYSCLPILAARMGSRSTILLIYIYIWCVILSGILVCFYSLAGWPFFFVVVACSACLFASLCHMSTSAAQMNEHTNVYLSVLFALLSEDRPEVEKCFPCSHINLSVVWPVSSWIYQTNHMKWAIHMWYVCDIYTAMPCLLCIMLNSNRLDFDRFGCVCIVSVDVWTSQSFHKIYIFIIFFSHFIPQIFIAEWPTGKSILCFTLHMQYICGMWILNMNGWLICGGCLGAASRECVWFLFVFFFLSIPCIALRILRMNGDDQRQRRRQ